MNRINKLIGQLQPSKCSSDTAFLQDQKDYYEKNGTFQQKASPTQRCMTRLVEEHRVILKTLSAFNNCVTACDHVPEGEKIADLADFLHFFAVYADKMHHSKEEDMLFRELEKTKGDEINLMYDHHKVLRGYMGDMKGFVQEFDYDSMAEIGPKYVFYLRDHIAKENEILYGWMINKVNEKLMAKVSKMYDDYDDLYQDDMVRLVKLSDHLRNKYKE